MHTSIKLDTPIEFINITPINPLISKCQIKVCYVGEEPNRNGSVITKEVAMQMANSLPGCPIVGFYNETKGDFEEHNRIIDISNGKFEIKDTTRPYGFVDLGAKAWFQKFLDDGMYEREYLMTEGYIWTGQYEEARRILKNGNNQSMELSEDYLNAEWAEDKNGFLGFFIINEAVISKLCVLGEDNEPCFEGANITAPTIQFSFEDSFKEQLFSMMNELKDLLNKGGEKVFNRYSVEIGDTLWVALYNHVNSTYSIEGVYEDGEQKFAVLKAEDKYYRMNIELGEEITFAEATELGEYTPDEEAQFSAEDIAAYAQKISENSLDNSHEDEPIENPNIINEEPVISYNLEEIPEYIELQNKYNTLIEEKNDFEAKYNAVISEQETLKATVQELKQFKLQVERKEKEAMIADFYMLTDEDKADVITNIDTYSLEDIEAKLSVICVRNKVNFTQEEKKEEKPFTSFSLNEEDDLTPAWIKAALEVAKKMN